jgi:hypothetical protein
LFEEVKINQNLSIQRRRRRRRRKMKMKMKIQIKIRRGCMGDLINCTSAEQPEASRSSTFSSPFDFTRSV